MPTPERLHVDPPLVRKVARILVDQEWTAAWFVGPATALPYTAEDTARCDGSRCPTDGDHPVPSPLGSCGFHGGGEQLAARWMAVDAAVLDVELGGRLVRTGDGGWRASSQRVLGARLLRGCVDCRSVVHRPRLTTGPGDPAVGLPVVPRCPGCASRWAVAGRRTPRPLADLAGLLLTEVSWTTAGLAALVLGQPDEGRLVG